jgi:5-methylthioadenosine/S-adenosylhomocysteine deaminase
MTVVVRAGWVLTMGPLGDIADGAVAFDGGRIIDVGPFVDVSARHPGAELVGDAHGILLPGFVNAHTHLSEGLVRGMGEEWTLPEWGSRVVGPAGRVLTAEMGRVGGALACAEMAVSGVTCVSDMFCHANLGSLASLGAADAVEAVGLRAVLSFGPEDLGYFGVEPGDATTKAILDEHLALVDRCATSPLLDARIGVGTLNGQSDDLLQTTVMLAGDRGLALHIHLHEVREEITESRLQHGVSPLERLLRFGGFDLDVLAAHVIWVTDEEMDELAARGVAPVHNPVANMILADGVCPVPSLRARAMDVAIGTDGAASNDSQDMLQAMKCAALLQKVVRGDPRVITARDVLEMATIDGARALGLEQRIGSLEVGKQADMVRFDGVSPALAAVHDAAQAVVYSATPRDVADVWVDGRRIVEGGALVTVEIASVVEQARPLARRLASEAALPSALR